MTLLLHATITLLIFISSILSSNPNLICLINSNNAICTKQIIEEQKSCCASKKEKEVDSSCFAKSESIDCDLSTKGQLKRCLKCSFSQPIKSAILTEQKPTVVPKTIALFDRVFLNTSNRYFSNFSKTYNPIGIHSTISSTILLL